MLGAPGKRRFHHLDHAGNAMRIARPLLITSLFALTTAGLSLADSDKDHKRYKHPRQLAISSTAPQLWKDECGSCHMLYSPGLLPGAAWQQQMDTLQDHYGSNAALEPQESQEILDYLLRASTGNRLPLEPSPTPGEAPRISQTRWFAHEHDEISEARFQRESVGGRFNCVACHRNAEHGDFDDDHVKIPR